MSVGEAGDDPQVVEGFLPTIADARDAFAWLATRGFGDLPVHLPRAPVSTIQAITGGFDAKGVLIEESNSAAAAAGRRFGLLAAATDDDDIADVAALRADVARLERDLAEARITRNQYDLVTEALEKLRVAVEADGAGGRGGWRTIESVPLDMRVLVYIPEAKTHQVFAGRCSTESSGERVWFIDGMSIVPVRLVTMWRPMPDLPSAGG